MSYLQKISSTSSTIYKYEYFFKCSYALIFRRIAFVNVKLFNVCAQEFRSSYNEKSVVFKPQTVHNRFKASACKRIACKYACRSGTYLYVTCMLLFWYYPIISRFVRDVLTWKTYIDCSRYSKVWITIWWYRSSWENRVRMQENTTVEYFAT